jgi:signal transduction histidine kinase
MKIRDKFLLAFGLYIFIALVLSYFAYRELRTISTRLALVEIADDLTNTILEVRRYEKNFLLYRDQQNFLEVKHYLGLLKEGVDNIKTEIITEIGDTKYAAMKQAMAVYEGDIEALVVNFVSQRDLEAGIRASARTIERGLSGQQLQSFLLLRRYEKNVMIYKNPESYGLFERTLAASGIGRDRAVAEYRDMLARLYRLYTGEKRDVEAVRVTAREIQGITQRVSEEERAKIAATIITAQRLLLISLLAVIAVGTVVNLKLAKSIVGPLKMIEQVTKKVAAGDFSQTIPVRGRDELASFETAFNQMEERLRDTTEALEDTIKILMDKQAKLVEAEKLASVGMLAAGIAHEINNPLTSVLTFSHLMLEQCPQDDPHCDKLKMIARETERARIIVRQLLNFAKETTIKPVRISVNRPVTEIIESLVAQEAFKGISLDMRLAEDLPEASIDPAQIGQVVLNIALNAIHAITPPGRIEIATRAAARYVEVVFTDTGAGIPEEHLSKIFDPFFTTKDASRGTGLGLAVSYGIVKKHGGDIVVSSAVGKGSTFTVRLPINGQV